MLVGDFNLHDIDWNGTINLPLSGTSVANNMLSKKFLDFVDLNNLNQFNHVLNKNKRTLDLVLSNQVIDNLNNTRFPLVNVDLHHPPIDFCVSLPDSSSYLTKNISQEKFNYHKANYSQICTYLSTVDWDEAFLPDLSVDDWVSKFYEVIRSAIEKFVPKHNPRSDKFPAWYTHDLKRLLREKNKYRVRFNKYNNPLDQITFVSLKKRCIMLSAQCYNKYVSHVESVIKSNPKYFFSYIKQKRKNSSNYPSTMHLGTSSSASTGPEICQLMADYLSSVYTYNIPAPDGEGEASGEFPRHADSLTLSKISFTQGEVLQALERLDIAKGAGADGIPALFARNCAKVLSFPLTSIFNRSLHLGTFPSAWKEALVVPIFKGGDSACVENYRPISLLSVFGKLFESLVCAMLIWHFKQFLIHQQHGFTRARSTATNLVSFTSDVIELVDSRIQADVIYTDFSKAFDRVDHHLLLGKLAYYGISGGLLRWCASYLAARTGKVVIDGYCSRPFLTPSGVPQGSHIGPIFFNLFINDISLCFKHSNIYLYADDLKILKSISCIADSHLLQEDLNRLALWCRQNRLTLNTDKCHYIAFTRNVKIFKNQYFIEGHKLNEVDSIRDLGVILDKKLNFNAHLDKMISSALKLLGFVIRCSKGFKNACTKITLFNALVRSKLEYCSVVWAPHYQVHESRIERVQKRFLYHLTYQSKLCKKIKSYYDRLNKFNIKSLKFRRQFLDQIFLNKLLNGTYDCPQLISKITFNCPRRLPRPGKFSLFGLRQSKSNLGKFSPLNRILHCQNSLDKKFHLDVFHFKFPRFRAELLKVL